MSRAGSAPALVAPAGAQGPGKLHGALVEALDLLLARRASGVLPGDRRAAGLGDGTELAQIRPYQVGDDVRRLDAAASARTGSRTCAITSRSGRSRRGCCSTSRRRWRSGRARG